MKAIMCSIFDITTSTYRQPFYAANLEDAKRAFRMILGSNDLMKQNPSDFELYEMASFDDEEGILKPSYMEVKFDTLTGDKLVPKRLFKGGEVYREV